MPNSEIGGYEIRYKLKDQYTVILITDSSVTQKTILNVINPESTIFEVAVFDTDGIYSNFIPAFEN